MSPGEFRAEGSQVYRVLTSGVPMSDAEVMTKAVGKLLHRIPLDDPQAAVAGYRRVSAKSVGLSETWFRDAIFSNPELVIGPCREGHLIPRDEVWHPWATEFGLDAGPVDVLLVSSRGRIGIVETKLSFNPERRREVVAQILDYSLGLQELDPSDLLDMPGVTAAARPDPDDLQESLDGGNFLLIIAGDELDPRALRLAGSIVGAHLTHEWDLAMIDLNLFVAESDPQICLVVPELRGTVVHESRQVVRVVVDGAQTKPKIQIEHVVARGHEWTKEGFVDALALNDVAQPIRRVAEHLCELPKRYPGVTVTMGRGQRGILQIGRNGKNVAGLYEDGTYSGRPREYAERALGRESAAEFLASVERLLGPQLVDGWRSAPPELVAARADDLFEALSSLFAAVTRRSSERSEGCSRQTHTEPP